MMKELPSIHNERGRNVSRYHVMSLGFKLQKIYKVYYDWLNPNYLICITLGTILFKTKYLPELCLKSGLCLLDNKGNTNPSPTDQ